jgi:hypothetical protein
MRTFHTTEILGYHARVILDENCPTGFWNIFIISIHGLVYFHQHTKQVFKEFPKTLVGKSIRNPAEFRDYSDSRPFELRNFHRNFIFPIVKCVPTNPEHVPSGSESSPAIDSSDFMNRKTFSPFIFFWPANMTFTHIPQPVDPTMLNCMDVGANPGIAIFLPI